MSSPVLVSPSAPHLRCRCSAPVRPRRTSFALSFAHLLQLVFGRAGGCRHIAPTLVAPAALRTRARRAGAAEDACLCCPDAFYGGCLSRAGSYVAETDRPCSREAIGSVCTKLKAINVSIFARRSRVLVPPTPGQPSARRVQGIYRRALNRCCERDARFTTAIDQRKRGTRKRARNAYIQTPSKSE